MDYLWFEEQGLINQTDEWMQKNNEDILQDTTSLLKTSTHI